MKDDPAPLDVDAILAQLKDFQRASVEYVFKRLYLDEEPARRFLVADEVGLGKTLVARGVIAKAIQHLREKEIPRIDIVYICSNADIARQNINRLNVTGQQEFALASRITLLPVTLKDLKDNELNFISFTPGTAFELRGAMGTGRERALLYWLLKDAWDLQGTGPLNLLQGTKGRGRFREMADDFPHRHEIDPTLKTDFEKAVCRRVENAQKAGEPDIRTRFHELAERFRYGRDTYPDQDRRDQRELVGELRALLATSCLSALEPDLIILDEFQRFKHLLDAKDDASELARNLFEFDQARVLLLSATPYKMYTLEHEAGTEDHYEDFVRTVSFLQGDPRRTDRFKDLLGEYVHDLKESLGLIDKPSDQTIEAIAIEIRDALSLRTAQLRIDLFTPQHGGVAAQDLRMRARFAARFGQENSDDDGRAANLPEEMCPGVGPRPSRAAAPSPDVDLTVTPSSVPGDDLAATGWACPLPARLRARLPWPAPAPPELPGGLATRRNGPLGRRHRCTRRPRHYRQGRARAPSAAPPSCCRTPSV